MTSAARNGPVAARAPLSRRRLLKRVVYGTGGVLAGIAALGIVDADREETGGPLFTRQLGTTGPAFVFLPGMGATTRYWELVVGAMAGRLRMTLIDLLGFGRSPKPWTTYSVDRHLAELERVIAPLTRDGPVTLVGHSVGARLALVYAARHPEQVQQLVLVSMPYFAGGDNAKRFFGQRDADGWLWTHLVPFALMCLLGRRLLGWAAPLMADDVPRAVAEDLNQMTWRSSTSTMWEVIYRYDLTADLGQLRPDMRVTFLHGDRDRSAPLARIRDIANIRPSVDVRVFPGGDHQLPIRQSAWLRDQLDRLVAP